MIWQVIRQTPSLPYIITTVFSISSKFLKKPHHTHSVVRILPFIIQHSALSQKVLTKTTADFRSVFTTPHDLRQTSRTFHNPQQTILVHNPGLKYLFYPRFTRKFESDGLEATMKPLSVNSWQKHCLSPALFLSSEFFATSPTVK